MAFGESWHIKSRTHTCVVSGKNFVNGEVIVAAIFPDPESSGWLRKDYSLDGWEQDNDERVGQFSQWKTHYKAPVASEKLEVSKESPIDLLRRLVEEEEEHTEKVRFILAVMLERQKVLVEKDTQAVPSGILRVYEHRKEGDVFLIKDPNIALDQVEYMQQEVIDLLESGGRLKVVESEEENVGVGESTEHAEPGNGDVAVDTIPIEQGEDSTSGSDDEHTKKD